MYNDIEAQIMKVQNLKYLFYKSNIKQLTIVSTMVANTALGIAQLILSLIKLSLFLGFSGFYNVVLALGKFYALERLLRINSLDPISKNTAEAKAIDRINFCTLICSLIFFCFGIVIAFFYEDPANYDIYTIVFILTTTIFKFFGLIYSIVYAIIIKNGVKNYVKLMSVASFLVTLALTQRALLYYMNIPSPSLYSGIGGIFFSFLALLVGLYMIFKASRQRKKFHSDNLIDPSFRTINAKLIHFTKMITSEITTFFKWVIGKCRGIPNVIKKIQKR